MDGSNSTHQSTRLFISSVSLQDSGNYECMARNHPEEQNRYRGQDIGVTVLRELGGWPRREGGRKGGSCCQCLGFFYHPP